MGPPTITKAPQGAFLVMPAIVYILYSSKIDKYYIGATSEDAALRLKRHNSGYYKNKYTSAGQPWQLYLTIPRKGLLLFHSVAWLH